MKKCKQGYYYCYDEKKCKKIPSGYRVGLGGWLRKEKEEEKSEDNSETETKKNGNGNGNGDSGAVSEGWSEKYKKSIDCKNPKGFSQRAHCQGKKKVNEAKEKGDHEVSMAQSQLKKSEENIRKLRKALGTKEKNIPAWVQAKITDTEHNTDAASSYMEEGKRDGKSAKDKGYSLRDWFKGGGWVQAGGKYDGKPCAKQPGQKTKPFCRDADDRAAMSKEERNKRAKKKRKEDPNPNRKGKAKNVTEVYDTRGTKYKTPEDALKATKEFKKQGGEVVKPAPVKLANSFSNWRQELELSEVYNKPEGSYQYMKSTMQDKSPTGGLRPQPWKKEPKKDPLTGMPLASVGDNLPRTSVNVGNQFKGNAGMMSPKEIERSNKGIGPRIQGTIKLQQAHYEPEGEVVSEKKDACYHKVKSRYKIWPSAYASGALVKCRKVGAKNWGNKTKKEGYEFSNWRDDFQPIEIETVDLITADPIQVPPSNLQKIEEAKKCWKGYKKVGTQKLFGKTYNRCEKIKKEEFSDWRQELEEDWQKVNKKDKTDGMSQKAVDAYKRENPGSKLKTAVTEKNPGGKRAKRRKSFCARSNGQRKMHNIDCSKTPDKAICKARKRWRC